MKTLLILISVICPLTSVFSQGSLTPPAAPSPTMKTLQQIEPRTEVNATNTPGSSAALFVISSPGSYYLSGNIIGVTNKDGIEIAAADVTLDLNGFQLKGTRSPASGAGVRVSTAQKNLAVRNGIIRDWSNGGIWARLGTYCIFENLRLHNNAFFGLETGIGSLIRGCNATENAVGFRVLGAVSLDSGVLIQDCVATNNSDGIYLDTVSGAVVRDCTASGSSSGGISAFGGHQNSFINCAAFGANNGGISADDRATLINCSASSSGGISAGEGSTLTNCTAMYDFIGIDVGTGSTLTNCTARLCSIVGIQAGDGSTITHCTVSETNGDGISVDDFNVIRDCTLYANAGNGILASVGCQISDCVIALNGKKPNATVNTASDGIEFGNRNRVLNCTIYDNAQHGINSTNSNSRNFIEGCLIYGNDAYGIFLQNNSNAVIKNYVAANSTGPINQTGGSIAPIQNASDAVGSMHPLANFQ